MLSKLSNRQYLIINLLETPILSLLLASIIKFYNVDATNNEGYIFQNNPNIVVYIIMCVIIALFVGLTVSSEEIISDRKILKREEFLNLSRFSYLISKVFILSIISAIQTFLLVSIGNYIIELKGMFFEYWLVLFSVSTFANILGLNISDSFKQAVNIYILIPFLIIPQIILSGVFISYDHLNPKYSNPDTIPWYGEIITARWAFEALTVHQFKNNDFEKNFYIYDKIKSEAHFKKEYWVPALQVKLNMCEKLLESKASKQKIKYNLELLKHEITDENTFGLLKLDIPFTKNLSYDKINQATLDEVKAYLNKKKTIYRKLFNDIDHKLDAKKKALTSTSHKRQQFNQQKKNYHNQELEQFVKNTSNIFSSKIIEYNGKLVQKIDPIFKEPQSRLLKAHFLSPFKKLGDFEIDTIWANLIVIWFFNILLFILLQMALLKKLMYNFSEFYSRIKKE